MAGLTGKGTILNATEPGNRDNEKLSVHGTSIAIGGQAIVEGIMLRGPKHWVVGVRRPDNTISLEERKLDSVLQRQPFFRLPFIRGTVILVESMIIGMKALMMSSQTAAGEEEKLDAKQIAIALLMAAAIFLLVFKAAPSLFAVQLYNWISSDILINFLEGAFKIGLFVGYIWIISRVPDIRRVFEYHGAEHKVIHAYEAGDPLDPAAADRHTTIHTRCGTSFMLLVFFVSVVVFTFMGRPPLLERTLLHIAIIPLVAGISYELIKLAGRRPKSLILKLLTGPGLLLQRMTTNQPDHSQIEVAVATLERLMQVEGLVKVDEASGQAAPSVQDAAPA